MSANTSENIQKMKGVSICDPKGFTMHSEGTLKTAIMSHASQAFALLHRLEDTKETPKLTLETNQGNIVIVESNGDTIAMHK